jgi:hypothetical protein
MINNILHTDIKMHFKNLETFEVLFSKDVREMGIFYLNISKKNHINF